jgi:hypothetical protein
MLCKDPFLTYLKQSGYSVIRLPRAGFSPLQILTLEKREFSVLGELASVLNGAGVAPPIRLNTAAASISGQATADMRIGFGLSLLGTILGAMGAGTVSLETEYSKARSVTFKFSDVLVDAVDLTLLDQYLAVADINPSARHVSRLLETDDVYVVTATLKSRKIAVEGKGQNGAGVTLSVPAIQQVVGATVKVGLESGQASVITYEGEQSLTFGFQAARLFYDQGRYTAFKPIEPGVAAARSLSGLGAQEPDLYASPTSFVRIDG